jgi:prepilin-type N-terminal cleavage/methylation domain-containing protein
MKTPTRISRARGFSLIELMVVIGIIILLSGLLIAALPGIQTKLSRNRVEALIAEIEGGLSRYQLDHGIFPQNPPAGDDRDTSGLEGSAVLYKHLSGDYNEDGKIDYDQNEKVYVPKLDFESQKNAKDPRTELLGGDYRIVDAFGSPLRYLAQPPGIPTADRKTYNPTYDLWSVVDADPENEEEAARYITNWGAN